MQLLGWMKTLWSVPTLMVPKEEINNLYSWLLNFQILDEEFKNRLRVSKKYEENDIFVFLIPSGSIQNIQMVLSTLDTNHNCAVILGLNYFGELKKATLTLAWATAARNGYVACHGGLKILSKIMIKKISLLHFLVYLVLENPLLRTPNMVKNMTSRFSMMMPLLSLSRTDLQLPLEPSYFDKTSDYPTGHREQDFFITVQNCRSNLRRKMGERC